MRARQDSGAESKREEGDEKREKGGRGVVKVIIILLYFR